MVFHKTDLSMGPQYCEFREAQAVLADEDGDEMVLALFEKGAFFDELSLLDGKGRSAIIVADTDAEVAILKKDVFLDLLYKNPRNSVELMTTLVDGSEKRMR